MIGLIGEGLNFIRDPHHMIDLREGLNFIKESHIKFLGCRDSF